MNIVILCGHLCRDWETREAKITVAGSSLAVNRTWKTESGEKKEEVTFVDLTAFGKQADTLAEYTKKGDPILIRGRLKFDQWEDRQTNAKRSKHSVVVEEFQFLNKKGDGEGESDRPRSRPASERAGRSKPADAPAPDDDSQDVPF